MPVDLDWSRLEIRKLLAGQRPSLRSTVVGGPQLGRSGAALAFCTPSIPSMSTLPPELEIHIFESVARASPYDAALRLTLMLVARRVQIWYVSGPSSLSGWSLSCIAVLYFRA
jgi:hypothetical protein